jgi:two-component system response regulator FlrC
MPNILVIDSDLLQRASLGQALASVGEIEIAGTGLDALRLLATKKFSVVILDLHVRPLDGFVILRTLSSKGGPNKETPVYALAVDAAERDRALQEHAVFALIKPISFSTVKILIEAGLNRPSPAPVSDEETPTPGSVPNHAFTMGETPKPPPPASVPPRASSPSLDPPPSSKESPRSSVRSTKRTA